MERWEALQYIFWGENNTISSDALYFRGRTGFRVLYLGDESSLIMFVKLPCAAILMH